MNDKKDFGLFIKSKRLEKNLSQKDLADILYVTESAISKWERGLSYPDITMVASICKALEISEHELITSSTDNEYRKEKSQAKKFRTIKSAWFLVPTISYAIALLTCFICNLAVNHTLSWFFIVFSSILCAYAFVPTYSMFANKNKFLVFIISSLISISFLLSVCGIIYGNFLVYLTAILSVLIGYILVFSPVCLGKFNLPKIVKRFRYLITLILIFVVLVLMLYIINCYHPFAVWKGIIICIYCFVVALVCSLICLTKQNAYLKSGENILIISVFAYLINAFLVKLLDIPNNSYTVNFTNWKECVSGNCNLIVLIGFLILSIVLITVGVLKSNKKNKY